MPGDLLIDAVRVQSAGQDKYICDLPEPRGVKRAVILGLGAISAALLLAVLLLSTHQNVSATLSAPEMASLKQFDTGISGIEKVLSQSTTSFVLQGRLALNRKDPIAIFDATNQYSDVLDRLGEAVEHLPLPDKQSGQSLYWARTAVSRLKGTITEQRKYNDFVVVAANRAAVNKELFDTVEARALKLDSDQCQELRLIRRTLETAGIAPAAPAAACSSH